MFASNPSSPKSSSDYDASEIEELRAKITELSTDVAKIVELRAKQAQRVAGHAADSARGKVEDYPLASMAGAFALGAAIGLLVMEGRSEPRSRYATARDDLASYADDLRRSLSRTAKDYSLTDRLDRMAAALSTVDAKETVQPAFERVLGWLGQAKAQAKSAAEAATAKVTG